MIAFHRELDAWLNPALFRAATGTPLPPSALAGAVEVGDSRVTASYVTLDAAPGRSAMVGVRPRDLGRPPGYDQVFVDPTNGRVLGTRAWGACCLAPARAIPFLYRLHYSLAAGMAGRWLMGGVAVLWAVNSAIGAVLTLPRARPMLRRWRAAWLVKRSRNPVRLNGDLHRAGGLWLWGVLLVVAVSGVALALPGQVFRPALGLVLRLTPELPPPAARAAGPAIGFDDAVRRAEAEMRARGASATPAAVFHLAAAGRYMVTLRPERGIDLGPARLWLDDRTGTVLRAVPNDGDTPGDLVLRAQGTLHNGRILGLPGRILVCVSGLATAMLSGTGIAIWWIKRRARLRSRGHARRPAHA